MNQFSSADPVKPIDLSTIAVAPEWVISPKPPLATPGHHRFVWDLHYAKPTGLKDDDALAGVWAPPGRYTVELDVAGHTLRQPLNVIADPRVKVSQADFEAEFRLAKRIEQARVRVRRMLEQAAELKTGLGKTQRLRPSRRRACRSCRETRRRFRRATAPTTLTSISEWLDNLAQAVDGADGAPTPDNVQGLCDRHARRLTSWNRAGRNSRCSRGRGSPLRRNQARVEDPVRCWRSSAISSPRHSITVMTAEPPKLTSGKGTPTTGARPITIIRLIAT